MKHIKLLESFLNESISFNKKGIKVKLEDKLRLAKIAVEKWGDSYSGVLNDVEYILKSGKLPSYKEPLMVQGDTAKDSYDIFQGRNAVKLAEAISKVIKKYKKYEIEQSSVPAAGGWSGTMRSTVGGKIEGRANFNPGGRRVPALARTSVGDPISSLYGFEVLGIFQSDAEANAWAPYGTTGYNAAGKFKYADIDNNGVINDDDRTIIGNPHPDFVYGINLNLNYKNFNLTVFGNGVVGNDIYNYVRYFADFNTFQGNRSTRALTEAWQPSNPSAPRAQWIAANPDATSPIMDANDQTSSRTSSYLVEDGSYFRLRNVQLTYTFGDSINKALGVNGGNIYLQGQNLFTITDYSGLNPEIQTGNDIQLGYDGGFMPVSRTVLVGLNVSLF